MSEEENSISFFMLVHKNPKATEFCLQTVRKFYENNKIIMFENGSRLSEEIAKRFNVTYIHQPINYHKPRDTRWATFGDMNDVKLCLEQHKFAIKNVDTKWLIYLESDVIIRNKIKIFPNKSAGCHKHWFNKLPKELQDNINKIKSDKNIPITDISRYGLAGGSIYNVKDFRFCLDSNWEEYIPEIFQHIRPMDILITYLFYRHNMELEDWQDYCELHVTKNEYRRNNAAVVHGFKKYYGQ